MNYVFICTDTKFYYILAFCAFEGHIWKQVVSNRCLPVLLTEHKHQQFFSYVMVQFRYAVICQCWCAETAQ